MFLVTDTAANQELTFTITDTKLYIPVVSSKTRDNVKLLKQLEWGFKRRINWNKYQPGTTEESQKLYLDFLITSGFHGENRLFVSSFENKNVRESYKRYFFPTLEIKLTAICKCFYLLKKQKK